MDDKDLKNAKLEDLHKWLSANVGGYLALCEAGSTTAGDPWVEGRTDRDITIVVEELTSEIEEKIRPYLVQNAFNDAYLFIVFSKAGFLENKTDQDISMKFRGATLFGIDLVAEKESPSREFALEIGTKGLQAMSKRFRTRLMNSGFWSVEHLKDETYQPFKHLFMYLAAKVYGQTGNYPRQRQDVAEALGSDELRVISGVLSHFADASKEEVVSALHAAIEFQSKHVQP